MNLPVSSGDPGTTDWTAGRTDTGQLGIRRDDRGGGGGHAAAAAGLDRLDSGRAAVWRSD